MGDKQPRVRWGRPMTLNRVGVDDSVDSQGGGEPDIAGLPSAQAHNSDLGTLLARQKMREQIHKMRRAKTQRNINISLSHSEAKTLSNASTTDIELKDYAHLNEIDDEDDEQMHLKKMKGIKEMPTSIAMKRKIRDKLLTEPVRVSKGCAHWKYRRSLAWNRTKITCHEISLTFEVWRSSFRTIEGHFGSGVASYFIFLKWLFFLNVYIAFLILLFILVPQVAFAPASTLTSAVVANDSTAAGNLSVYCSDLYTQSVNVSEDPLQLALDFFSGTGYMERTVLFFGVYLNTEVLIGVFEGISHNYNMPLAYLCVTGAYILLSLFLMARQSASGFRESLVSSEDKYYQYCNKVFGGWDFSLRDEKNACLKNKSLYMEFVSDLEEERDLVRREGRSNTQLCGVYTARAVMNILVLAILGASGYLIYYVMEETVQLTQTAAFATYHIVVKYLIEFLPSLTITVLNILVPFLFKKFVIVEDYTPQNELQLTLLRTVFLRLASLAVLIATLYTQVESCDTTKDTCNVADDANCPTLRCWETYVGQQLYKLVITDFIVTLAKPVLIEFPRKLIVTKCKCKLSKIIGLKEFIITDNVLNLVYSQTICWLGAFFSPLIPVITMLKFFLMFYIQKVTLLYTHVPSKRPYRASNSSSFFMIVLLASFGMCCLPIGWVIAKMPPSKGCGPFRVYSTCFEIITLTMSKWPSWFQTLAEYIASAGFVIPCLILLILIIYYYSALLSAHKKMVGLLKDQLVLEGRDKHFLLTRINQLTGKPTDKKNEGRVPQTIAEDVDNQSHTIRHRNNASVATMDETRPIQTPPNVPY